MIGVSHISFGAATSSAIQKLKFLPWWLQLALISITPFCSHFLLDSFSHLDYWRFQNNYPLFLFFLFTDVWAGFLIILFGARLKLDMDKKTFLLFLGSFFSVLPDLIKFLWRIILFENKTLVWFVEIHDYFHFHGNDTPFFFRAGNELSFIFLAFLILRICSKKSA